MKKNTSGFTFVELIVVVLILGILSTIGFMSYSGYLEGARDGNRISQTKDIYKSLQLYATNKRLPTPDDAIEITASGALVGYQGYAGETVLNTIQYSNGGLDPKDKQYFTLFVSKNKKDMQVLTLLEETDNLQPEVAQIPFVTKTHANYINRYPKTTGKPLGVLVQENTNIPVQEITSYQANGEIDVVTSGDDFRVIFSDTDTIVGSGSTLALIQPDANCKRILDLGRGSVSGTYNINPTGSEYIEVYCDMETDGGGWTRVIFVNNGDTLWNAWNTDESLIYSSGNQKFGIRIDQFSGDVNGEDIEYMFSVDGEQKGPIYTDVNYQAWDNTMGSSYFDTEFYYKEVNQSSFTLCNKPAGIRHSNDRYNWSITKGGGTDCNEHNTGGGFLAYSSPSGETFDGLYGLNQYDNYNAWSKVEIYIR